MKKYFLGIDIGTFESKGVLIDEDCQIVADHAIKHDLENPKPNYFEHDAEKVWWGDFCQISKTLISKADIRSNEISCVGSSALGADCLPVDEDCRPLRKAILYGIDSRADNEMAYLTEYYGAEKVNQIYGRPLCSSDVAPKILWIKNNEPEVYRRTHKYLTSTSYLTAKLTGNYVIDKFLINTFAPAYQANGSINEQLCGLFCRPDQLAECRGTTDIVGKVTARAGVETGLAEGTPVITGTDDSGAEAISTGIFQPGDMMIQVGSTCYMIYCSDRLVIDERIWHDEFIIPGTFSVSAGTNTAGTMTRWYRDNLFYDAVALQAQTGRNAYETMLDHLDDIPAGSDGLITLPYFAGERTPINDPFAKGVIFGLGLNHTRAHLYKSALEGVGYSIEQHLEIIKEHDLPIKKIMAVGGGAKNTLWLKIIADITNQTIYTANVTIGAAYGDALMAALAFGQYKGFADFDGIIKPCQVIEPDAQNHERYIPYQKIFTQLYKATKELMHSL
ncbi:MAG: FGGY-family carbohydrate kinase [Anaerolineaceae bacterium]|nr:FGGY-family carbohydrate kinase [Anaerolineaceae bacterium]